MGIKKEKSLQNKIKSHFNKNRGFLTIISIGLSVMFIIALVFATLLPPSNPGFSELSLLMFNEEAEQYEPLGFPKVLNRGTNETVYFMVRNFEQTVKYYQLRITVVRQDVELSSHHPISEQLHYKLYDDKKFEKILPFGQRSDIENVDIFSGDHVWGPQLVDLYADNTLHSLFGNSAKISIVFELFAYSSRSGTFLYTGLFTFLLVTHYI